MAKRSKRKVVGVSVKRKGRTTVITKTVVKKSVKRRPKKGIFGLNILGIL